MNTPSSWCALESLLRIGAENKDNPMIINVWQYERAEDKSSGQALAIKKQLSQLGEIAIHPINFTDLFLETPLYDTFIADGQVKDIDSPKKKRRQYLLGTLWKQNLGNGARLAILLKHGGIYLDLDHIVLKDVRALPYGFATVANKANNAFMHFPRSHPFLQDYSAVFVKEYNGSKWGHNGPRAVEKVWQDKWARKCQGSGCNISPLPSNITSIVRFSSFNELMLSSAPSDDVRSIAERIESVSYALHFFNKVSAMYLSSAIEEARRARGQRRRRASYASYPLGYLKLKYCPLVTDLELGLYKKSSS
tara:strand:+ start:915 stop:1835 length:921 start_codon:yes stop_codon:yes gene_type:complete